MRTRETEKVLNVLTNPKTRLAFAVRLSITYCQNKIDGKSEGEFPLCVLFPEALECCNICPMMLANGGVPCVHSQTIDYVDFSLLRTTRQRRHFRKLHWEQMKVLLEEIRDQKVGLL